MSGFWNWWVIVLTVVNVLACYWLIKWTTKARPGEVSVGATMKHSWDGLQELNNPLPRWWLWLFYITLIFAAVYFALYPGLGNFQGVLGWTQVGQYEQEVKSVEDKVGPMYKQYAAQDLATLAKDPKAMAIGNRLYLNYCAQCHGSDAGGGPGFPNLKDGDWMYGNSPDAVKTSILEGRAGVMPALGAALGEEGTKQVVAYVMSLSGRDVDAAAAAAGKPLFEANCAACHMPDGTGNQAMGAPNLTDKVWVHGGTADAIKRSITHGFNAGGINSQMPAFKDFLGEDRVHILAAYVLSLSGK